MGRLKKRTTDPLLNAAANAAQPPETNCRVDKSGPSQEPHTLPFAGSNPAPATTFSPEVQEVTARAKEASAEVDALVASAAWHGPRSGKESVEQHHARYLRAEAENVVDQLQREILLVAAARLDGGEV
jgi:hypothetical protein